MVHMNQQEKETAWLKVALPFETYLELKSLAASKRITLRALVTGIIDQYLEWKKQNP